MNESTTRLHADKDNVETDLQDMLHEQEELQARFAEAKSELAEVKLTIESQVIREETRMRALVETCIRSAEKLTSRTLLDDELDTVADAAAYLQLHSEQLQTVLGEMAIVHGKYRVDPANNVESLARKVIGAGHLMATIQLQARQMCNASTDIESGESRAMRIYKKKMLDFS